MRIFDFLFSNKQDKNIDFKKLAKAGALILDVRTEGEFEAGHIKSARNIDVEVLENYIYELKEYEGQIIAYCRSGRRSGRATDIMVEAGIKAVNGGGYEKLKVILA